MDKNSIIESIPNIIAGLYEGIYLICDNEYYHIRYDGSKMVVSKPEDLKEMASLFTNYKEDVLKYIFEDDNLKKVFKTKDSLEKLVITSAIDDKKLVLISDITFIKQSTSSSPKILIADDSMIICNFFKKALDADFDIITASNGEEAIACIEKYKNDNLLGAFVDLNMPGKNGYDVIDYMRNNNLMDLIPVSVISGEDSAASIERVIELGAVDM